MTKVSRNVGYLLTFTAAIFWATSGIFAGWARDAGATSMDVAIYADVIAVAILFPAIAVWNRSMLRIDRADLLPFLLFSLVTGSFFYVAYFYALELTSVATTVVLLYTYPVITGVMAIWAHNEPLTREKVVALSLTFFGVLLVSGVYDRDILSQNAFGLSLGLYAGFAAAIYYIWGKKFVAKYSSPTVMVYSFTFSIPGMLAIALPLGLFQISLSLHAWSFILQIAVVSTLLGFIASLIALRVLEASRASIVATVELPAAAIMAYFLLSEQLSAVQTAGVALVFIGITFLRLRRLR